MVGNWSIKLENLGMAIERVLTVILVDGMILLICIFFLGNFSILRAENKMEIELVPFGQIESPIFDYLIKNLAEVFNAQMTVTEAQPSPEYAFDKKRRQYFSSVILEKLSRFKKDQSKKLLGLIDRDLFVPQLNFVFGEASPSPGICIISLTRLRQTYYGLPEDRDLFLKRTLKEAVHELGHLLHLGHCPLPSCVMHFSNSLLDTDRKDYRFCSRCQKLIS